MLSAHRVKSQGRPRTTSSSQLIRKIGLPVRVSLRRPLSRRHHAREGVGRGVSWPDNGTCFKRRWAEACAAHAVAVRKTRPYRPQTNGKAERFIRTLLERWAYAYPYAHESERLAALPAALDFYNRFPPHRALGGLTPLQRVNNVPGTYS